ncbi:hypothetical protein HYALB_00001818 [Hymenoscyphus albidus]|uniref:Uncharacterized protein n=1 Tax=Hymenoscyphus albidus TaxID=595503 RepID=A0A9N9PWZ4_9HELO|nr:hypothetical protein HYALB_00001818 [Hymenoscyphus albidus]
MVQKGSPFRDYRNIRKYLPGLTQTDNFIYAIYSNFLENPGLQYSAQAPFVMIRTEIAREQEVESDGLGDMSPVE